MGFDHEVYFLWKKPHTTLNLPYAGIINYIILSYFYINK